MEPLRPTEEDDEESQDEVPNDDDDLGVPAAGAENVDVVGPSSSSRADDFRNQKLSICNLDELPEDHDMDEDEDETAEPT